MDLKVCDGLYVRPYKYYPTAEIGEHELRYQVIFDGTDDGNKHIISPIMSGFKSEEAAVKYCDFLMRVPQWKRDLEVRIVSDRLRGYTVGYQLNHFDEVFRDWSDYEKGLARKILTGQLDYKREHRCFASSLDSVINSCEKMSKTNAKNNLNKESNIER